MSTKSVSYGQSQPYNATFNSTKNNQKNKPRKTRTPQVQPLQKVGGVVRGGSVNIAGTRRIQGGVNPILAAALTPVAGALSSAVVNYIQGKVVKKKTKK